MTDTTALLEKITGKPVHPDPKATGKVKAYAWARVSTDGQELRGLSIPQQFRDIHDHAEKLGIEIAADYSETASAFKGTEKRVEFHKMLSLARKDPEINAIIVHDYSRLSRESVDGMVLLKNLQAAGIRVLSVNDPEFDPDTVAGVFGRAFTFANNEAYSLQVAMHTRKGCRGNIQTRHPGTGTCYKNGGSALWGYRIRHVEGGVGKGGKPIMKSLWELDDTVIAGKPLHEWVKYCLVEMAGKGASYSQLSDFCNKMGIPGRRNPYWNYASWKDLLLPKNLLQYCGYGVWNCRGRNRKQKPPSEWVIVKDAHPAIITEDEASQIAGARREARIKSAGFDNGYHRSNGSRYLLSGGPFKCDRCGSNMIGYRSNGKYSYVCGSQPYRKGLGCGKGIYVPQLLVESQVIEDIKGLNCKLADPVRFTRKVNEELRRIWENQTGYDPNAEKRIKVIDGQIDHIRKLLVDGLDDVEWANNQVRELKDERRRLEEAITAPDGPLQVDSERALQYRMQMDRSLKQGTYEERKRYLRTWIDWIKLKPENREVEIRYRVPDSVLNSEGTGACPYMMYWITSQWQPPVVAQVVGWMIPIRAGTGACPYGFRI